jgi:hypothetical protein
MVLAGFCFGRLSGVGLLFLCCSSSSDSQDEGAAGANRRFYESVQAVTNLPPEQESSLAITGVIVSLRSLFAYAQKPD